MRAITRRSWRQLFAADGGGGGNVTEGTAAALTGNVLTNDDSGADGFGGVTRFVHDGVTDSTSDQGQLEPMVAAIETAAGARAKELSAEVG